MPSRCPKLVFGGRRAKAQESNSYFNTPEGSIRDIARLAANPSRTSRRQCGAIPEPSTDSARSDRRGRCNGSSAADGSLLSLARWNSPCYNRSIRLAPVPTGPHPAAGGLNPIHADAG